MSGETFEESQLRWLSGAGFSLGSALGTGIGSLAGPPGAATGFFVGGTIGGVALWGWHAKRKSRSTEMRLGPSNCRST